MFEISWSELLILGVVTLLLVGPKDLPQFLRMIGRHLAVVRSHANEFRAVFDQAMKEAELDSLQKDIRDIRDGVKGSLDEATRSVDDAKAAMRVDLNTNKAVERGGPTAPSQTPTEAAEAAKSGEGAPSFEAEPTAVPDTTVRSDTVHPAKIEADNKTKSAG